jgi:uncharacterized protein (TIGR03067 family)
MGIPLLAMLMIGCPSVAGGVQRILVKRDEEKLQGSWLQVSWGYSGAMQPSFDHRTVLFEGRKLIFAIIIRGVHDRTLTSEGTFRLDPSQRPKAIDFTHQGLDGKTIRSLGIYELKGTKLKLCFAAVGADRPAGFESHAKKKDAALPIVKVYERQDP